MHLVVSPFHRLWKTYVINNDKRQCTVLVNIHFSVNATEPFEEIARTVHVGAQLILLQIYAVYLAFLARYIPRDIFLRASPSRCNFLPEAERHTTPLALCRWLLFVPFPTPDETIGRRSTVRKKTGGAGVGGILSCSFVAIFMLICQWMGFVGRFACYAVSLLATYPLLSVSPPGVFPNCEEGALDYDEAGFMLQLRHKGICEAWLASTISPTTRLYLLACDELGDLNFRGCAIACYIVTRRIIVDAADSFLGEKVSKDSIIGRRLAKRWKIAIVICIIYINVSIT